MRIKLSTTLRWPIERQIPAGWDEAGVEFVINRPCDRCDAWVVYQGLHRPETTIVPPDRLFFFGYEPPGLHDYAPAFLDQFAAVVTCQEVLHRRIIRRHQAQPWLAGVIRSGSDNLHQGFGYRFGHSELAAMKPPQKVRPLSAVCSNKRMIPGHAERLSVIEALQGRLGDRLDLFGYGFRPLEDKWEAIAPYRYHLVLENSSVPNYWTEKLADAFLGWSVPIVWGCPNLFEYFPPESFLSLDTTDPIRAAAQAAEAISVEPSERRLLAVAEARRRVLDEYNLFAEIRRLAESTPAATAKRITLRDERLFLPGGWWRPIVRPLTDWLRRDT
jgi:hypothetical protein